MSDTTVTVYHPTVEASYDVPKDTAQAWVDQGWKKSEPKAVADGREATEGP